MFWRMNDDLMPVPDENTLREIIQRRLPERDQERLSYLRGQMEQETISEAEHQELLDYVDLVEQWDAERVAAMVQLGLLGRGKSESR